MKNYITTVVVAYSDVIGNGLGRRNLVRSLVNYPILSQICDYYI